MQIKMQFEPNHLMSFRIERLSDKNAICILPSHMLYLDFAKTKMRKVGKI